MKKQFIATSLTVVNVISFVASIYYFCPGFEHLWTRGTGSQPTAGAISVIVFLIAFFYSSSDERKRKVNYDTRGTN